MITPFYFHSIKSLTEGKEKSDCHLLIDGCNIDIKVSLKGDL